MTTAMILLLVGVAPPPTEKAVTPAEKQAFLELYAKLPFKGEFFTEEGVEKAAPFTRVLFALTEEDIGKLAPTEPDLKYQFYGFGALSRGLLDREEQRKYGVRHFGKIAHPMVKLFWGAVLFEEKTASPEVIAFLRTALKSKARSKILSEMLGGKFEDFKKRVKEYDVGKG